MTLAYIGVLQDWDWEAAERDFLKAIELVLKCFDCAVGCSPAPMQAERLFVAVSAPSASDDSEVTLDRLIDAAGVVCGVSSGR